MVMFPPPSFCMLSQSRSNTGQIAEPGSIAMNKQLFAEFKGEKVVRHRVQL
jgi:hypothetical protein